MTVTTKGRDLEWDIVMSYVAVEPAWRRGYGVACQALRGPKWVMLAAISWNSFSLVCHALHSSSVTYLHVDRHSLVLLDGGEGNRGFFVVLHEVVDDEVRTRLVAGSCETFHNHGGQCFDVPCRVDAGEGSDGERFTMAVVHGGVASAALYFVVF